MLDFISELLVERIHEQIISENHSICAKTWKSMMNDKSSSPINILVPHNFIRAIPVESKDFY